MWNCRVRTEELLALSILGRASRLGKRIDLLLDRDYAPPVSKSRVAISAAVLAGCIMGFASAPSIFAFAQRPQFDVTSVRRNPDGCSTSFGVGQGGSGGHAVTVKTLIGLAYRVQEFQISGGPNWIGSDRFDVEGKTEDRSADPDRLRLMLQALLEDRFQLKLHRETRDSAVYDLTPAKGGIKIKPSADQSAAIDGPSATGAPNHGNMRVGAGSLTGNAVTLTLFAKLLSQRLDRPIIDKTNLAGRYDIRLQWTPDPGENPLDPGGNVLPLENNSEPSIFAAIQEQLGLELKAARGLVEMLVIDRVERPNEN